MMLMRIICALLLIAVGCEASTTEPNMEVISSNLKIGQDSTLTFKIRAQSSIEINSSINIKIPDQMIVPAYIQVYT